MGIKHSWRIKGVLLRDTSAEPFGDYKITSIILCSGIHRGFINRIDTPVNKIVSQALNRRSRIV